MINRSLEILQGLARRNFIALVCLCVMMSCVSAVEMVVVITLWRVDKNQESAIKNEKSMAEASNETILETMNSVHQMAVKMETLSSLYARQQREIEEDLKPLNDIIRIDNELLITRRTVLKNQEDMLESQREVVDAVREAVNLAREAASAAHASAQEARNTNRTLRDKVATTPEKIAVVKKEVKLDKRAKEAEEKQNKLDSLVHQYKKAIRKVQQ